MFQPKVRSSLIISIAVFVVAGIIATTRSAPVGAQSTNKNSVIENATRKLQAGEHTFRFDTFGDEAFWGDTLKLHRAIEGARLGGVGPGVSPATALAVGLKVDVEALPQALKQKLAAGRVDLNDAGTTQRGGRCHRFF